jgi:transmembrane sensor
MSEINRHILQEAIAALPQYSLPVDAWVAIEDALPGNVVEMPETSILVDLWSNIEAQLEGNKLQLPEHKMPVDVWDKIEAQLEPSTNTEIFDVRDVPARKNKVRALSIAAGICLICVTAWYLIAGQKAALITYKGADARNCTLPDGSIITGQKNAIVQFPKAFADNARSLTQTEGQAFYNVIKDPTKPFSIATDIGTVTVLGTSFDVKLGADSLCVEVQTGKVRVENDSNAVELLADQAVVMYKDMNKPVRLYNINVPIAQPVVEDKTIKVRYDKTPLKQVVQQLSVQYGIVVLLHPSHEKKLISGSFASKNAIELLSTISKLYNLDLKKKKGFYLLD